MIFFRKHFLIKIITRLLSVAFALLLVGCDQGTSVDLGGRKISVPIPSGYSPVSKLAPNFFDFIKAVHSKSSVVVEYFLTKSDLSDVVAGHSAFREKSLMLTMPRELYGQAFSERDFYDLTLMQRRVKSDYVNQVEAYQNEENENEEQKSGVVPLLSSGSKWLGIVIDQHDEIGDAMVKETHNGKIITRRVSVSILIRVVDRLVSVGCESVVRDEQDIKSMESTCKKWTQNIILSNSYNHI